MRRDFVEPLTELQHHVGEQAILHHDDNLIRAFLPNPHQFVHRVDIVIGETATAQLVSKDSLSITVRPSADTFAMIQNLEETSVCQKVPLYDAPNLFTCLTNHWQQYWLVDDPDRDLPDEFHHFLDQVDQLPEFHVEVSDPKHWHAAIDSLKAHSARGVDGISAAELKQLPAKAIERFGQIMSNLQQFPSWMMIAHTIALPKKTGAISAAQVRPITIFAQLYRAWSRVVSQQVLTKFAAIMPSNITGFLKHRGPMDASMSFAYFLETVFREQTSHSGLVMDLVKCFNTICRKAAARVMIILGLPRWLVTMWSQSLDSMQRRWTINRQCPNLVNTNNGCPEGCTMSIVAMLSLGYLWIISISNAAPSARPTCYADNWGWSVTSPEQHGPILDIARMLTKVTLMQIDWTKSWTWASNSHTSKQVSELFAQLLPAIDLHHVRSAMDLGCQHTYRGCPTLGQFKECLQKAKRRLQRIQYMPHDSQVKTHLVMSGTYPAAM